MNIEEAKEFLIWCQKNKIYQIKLDNLEAIITPIADDLSVEANQFNLQHDPAAKLLDITKQLQDALENNSEQVPRTLY